jgi:membrane fusion protein, multidrug efflux system
MPLATRRAKGQETFGGGHPVDVASYDLAQVIVGQGLEPGDVVVTAGVQSLRPGEKVRLLGAAS